MLQVWEKPRVQTVDVSPVLWWAGTYSLSGRLGSGLEVFCHPCQGQGLVGRAAVPSCGFVSPSSVTVAFLTLCPRESCLQSNV